MTQKTVTVRALKSFTHEGRQIVAGQLVTMSPRDASISARQQEVSLDRAYNTQAVDLEPDPEPEPELQPVRRRRTYRRRDMTAEQT
jgi:hypothetical protein